MIHVASPASDGVGGIQIYSLSWFSVFQVFDFALIQPQWLTRRKTPSYLLQVFDNVFTVKLHFLWSLSQKTEILQSNSSSEESQEEMQRSKSETPKTNTSFTKPATSKTPQQGTSSGRQTPTLKRTPQVSTPSVKRAPSLTKPLTARTPQTGTPGVKKTPTIVRPVSGTHGAKKTPTIVKPVSAKTPLGQTGTKQTQPGAKVASGKSTPVLCSPKPRAARSSPSSAGARNVPAKRLRDSGGAKRDSKSTPVCILLQLHCLICIKLQTTRL